MTLSLRAISAWLFGGQSGSKARQRKSQEVAAVRSQPGDHEKEILLHLVGNMCCPGIVVDIALCLFLSFVVDDVFFFVKLLAGEQSVSPFMQLI